MGRGGFAPPHSVPFLRSLPPRTPASPPPTSLRQGPLPVASVPTAPSAPRSSSDPLVSPAPGPLAPGRPRSHTPRSSVSSGSRAHAGLRSLPPAPGPSRWTAPGNLPACPAGVPRQPTLPTPTPPAGTQPFSRRARPRRDPRPAALRLPERKARVSGPPPPPHLGPASLALTCRWPCTTPAPQTLPRPPGATKRHHLPHDNRPAPDDTSNFSIGWRGGGSLLRLVNAPCPSTCLYRPFSWTGSSPPPGPGPA